MFSTIDTEGVLFFNRLAISNNVWHIIANICAHYLIFVLFATAIIALILTRQYNLRSIGLHVLIQAFVATVLAMAIGFVCASIIARVRPYDMLPQIETIGRLPGNSSFPSEHTFISVAFATVFFLHSSYRKLGIVLISMALLIGIGRMMAGMHYPTDVLGGILVGLISSITVVYFAKPLFIWLGRWKGDERP